MRGEQSELLDGSVIEYECGGLLGRCIQHELDHLDGFLFTDRLAPEEYRFIERQLESLERAIEGKRLGGLEPKKELELLSELKDRMKLFNTEGY